MMKKDMADSVSMTHGNFYAMNMVLQEHYNQLKKFSPETLREIIAEIAGCHPSTSVLLGNKWLTPPRMFWSRLPVNTNEEYKLSIVQEREGSGISVK